VADHDGPLSIDEMKRNAARAALDFIEPGALIGVGSGTTVNAFIEALAEEGPHVAGALAASRESARHLADVGIPILKLADGMRPSIYIDGADEIDMLGRAIKGRGAAQTCEKTIALASGYWACVVDATKVVREFVDTPIPLEVDASQVDAVTDAVARMGGEARLRLGIMTDAGNPMMDAFRLDLGDPADLEDELDAIPGVIGNGVFAHRTADVIIVGRATGGIGRIVPRAESAH
jgi:ribose 5-phosphate isomerase A